VGEFTGNFICRAIAPIKKKESTTEYAEVTELNTFDLADMGRSNAAPLQHLAKHNKLGGGGGVALAVEVH